jgi:hypothetical protein
MAVETARVNGLTGRHTCRRQINPTARFYHCVLGQVAEPNSKQT